MAWQNRCVLEAHEEALPWPSHLCPRVDLTTLCHVVVVPLRLVAYHRWLHLSCWLPTMAISLCWRVSWSACRVISEWHVVNVSSRALEDTWSFMVVPFNLNDLPMFSPRSYGNPYEPMSIVGYVNAILSLVGHMGTKWYQCYPYNLLLRRSHCHQFHCPGRWRVRRQT